MTCIILRNTNHAIEQLVNNANFTEVRWTQMFVFYKAFISDMSEQCGLSIGSKMTSFNLHINGIKLKETLTVIRR